MDFCSDKRWRELNLLKLRSRVAAPLLVDFRNLLSEDAAVASGFDYWCIGRKNSALDLLGRPIAAE